MDNRRIACLSVMVALCVGCISPRAMHPGATAAGSFAPAARARVDEAFARLPLAFEPNRGQADPQAKFTSRGAGYALSLLSTEAVFRLGSDATPIRMRVIGANPRSTVTGIDELPGRSHYLVGSDPGAWRSGIPRYAAVRYEEIYPDVDLLYHGSRQSEIEYDFEVRPGADAAVIRLGFDGVKRLSVDADGSLVLHVGGGRVGWRAPVAYQDIAGTRRPVAARYEVRGRDEVGFRIGTYDRSEPLVIDPVLEYATYLGGSISDRGYSIAVDGSGSVYVSGTAGSTDFPTLNAFQATRGATGGDAFVTKFSPEGTLIYSTYLGGGDGSDTAFGIAVDDSGSAYVAGQTCASTFPSRNAFQATAMGGCDAFAAKLSPGGDALEYSTYLGGSAQDSAAAIAVDASGNAYVTGFTFPRADGQPTNFPIVNAVQPLRRGGMEAFVTALGPSGSSLLYSTYLGGSRDDDGNAIAVDTSGSAYIVGGTASTDFPIINVVQGTLGGAGDAFVTRLSPAGNQLVYSTYLGGNCSSGATGVALDASGSAWVAGTTCSTNFPTVNALQPARAGSTVNSDAFVARIAPEGISLLFSTYLGGSEGELAHGIALDAAGDVYVKGWTFSSDFPVVDAVQGTNRGPYDAFVTKLSGAGDALVYSTYMGGSDDDFRGTGGKGIAVDADGNAWVVGTTFSTNFPLACPFQGFKAGGDDAYLFKLGAGTGSFSPTVGAVTLAPQPSAVDAEVDLTASFTEGNCGTHTCSIDWGDGSPVGSGTVGSNACTGSHTYGDDGSYTVTVTVTDGDGSSDSNSATHIVSNAHPNVGTVLVSPEPSAVGAAVTASATFNDPDGADGPFSCTVNYGSGGTAPGPDGAFETASSGDVAGTIVGNTCTGPSHVYPASGNYTVRIWVEDRNGGVGANASVHVVTDDGVPVITQITGPVSPIEVGRPVAIAAAFSNPASTDTHGCSISWGNGSVTPAPVVESSGSGTCNGSYTYSQPGVYVIAVTVADDDGQADTESYAQYVVVYDPSGGFVTGGGWIDSPPGAYAPDPELVGKANFGFVSRYHRSTPTGETEFQFKAGDLSFHSSAYEWLVVSGAKARYRGTGTVNGVGAYGFELTAWDGQAIGGGGIDRFRIKIWNGAPGNVVYDNQIGAPDGADPTTALGGGSIVVHKGR